MNPFDEHFDDVLAPCDWWSKDPDAVRCRKCGADGLRWESRGYTPAGKEIWRLYEADGTQHECRNQASADEFGAV